MEACSCALSSGTAAAIALSWNGWFSQHSELWKDEDKTRTKSLSKAYRNSHIWRGIGSVPFPSGDLKAPPLWHMDSSWSLWVWKLWENNSPVESPKFSPFVIFPFRCIDLPICRPKPKQMYVCYQWLIVIDGWRGRSSYVWMEAEDTGFVQSGEGKAE